MCQHIVLPCVHIFIYREKLPGCLLLSYSVMIPDRHNDSCILLDRHRLCGLCAALGRSFGAPATRRSGFVARFEHLVVVRALRALCALALSLWRNLVVLAISRHARGVSWAGSRVGCCCWYVVCGGSIDAHYVAGGPLHAPQHGSRAPRPQDDQDGVHNTLPRAFVH